MDNNIDLTKYPEGYMEVVKHCDFLPDDENFRKAMVDGMVETGLFY